MRGLALLDANAENMVDMLLSPLMRGKCAVRVASDIEELCLQRACDRNERIQSVVYGVNFVRPVVFVPVIVSVRWAADCVGQ